jgi:aminomethyltransferase
MDVGRVFYTPWCDEDGFVIDDGTVARLSETTFRMTSADPTLRWLVQNARGLDVSVDDVSERTAALALQDRAPRRASRLRRRRHRSSAVLPGHAWHHPRCASRDIANRIHGDLGYEVWVDAPSALTVWDAIVAAGQAMDIKPAGMLALDVARVEAVWSWPTSTTLAAGRR